MRGVTALRPAPAAKLPHGNFDRRNSQAYKIVRTLEDGQRVQVATFQDLNKARGLVASLNEYWPGAYAIVPSSAEKRSACENY